MNHYEFQRFMAYQKCIVEVLALDFDKLTLCEIVRNHGQEMRNAFHQHVPYYKAALRIQKEEYHLVTPV